MISEAEIKKLIESAVLKEKLEDATLRAAAGARAMCDPLPGPANTIVQEDILVQTSMGIVPIRPFMAYDSVIGKKLNSFLYRLTLEAANKEEQEKELKNATDEDMFELIYQFTNPCKLIRSALNKGRDVFREEALTTTADKYPVKDIPVLVNAIFEQINNSLVGKLDYEVVDNKDKGDVVAPNFPSPSPTK